MTRSFYKQEKLIRLFRLRFTLGQGLGTLRFTFLNYGFSLRYPQWCVLKVILIFKFPSEYYSLKCPTVPTGRIWCNKSDRVFPSFLVHTSGIKIISRNAPINWPLRLCNLILLGDFAWGSVAYTDKLTSTEQFENNIRSVIRTVILKKRMPSRPEMVNL